MHGLDFPIIIHLTKNGQFRINFDQQQGRFRRCGPSSLFAHTVASFETTSFGKEQFISYIYICKTFPTTHFYFFDGTS